MSIEACDSYFRETMTKVANVVEDRYLEAVSGAMDWGRAYLPKVAERCDARADEELTVLRNNGLIAEFKVAALDFCRARLELYKAHALAMEAAA
ncbi:hypothetical protein [Geopsychrobacter electrodiphilus]|uniref:hypothetical protein n=1 Tax=Geopsychrobacter electrodiphilus TaxID=225196 RepID=UPI0003756704|nr:hypothetical protein [Geopsychrobacter electrodiphilus]